MHRIGNPRSFHELQHSCIQMTRKHTSVKGSPEDAQDLFLKMSLYYFSNITIVNENLESGWGRHSLVMRRKTVKIIFIRRVLK